MKHSHGYIALVSAIVISLVLLVLAITLSMSGYFSRFNGLDYELRQKSLALAEGCADAALLNLVRNPSYTGNETIAVGQQTCRILPIPPASGGQTIITTKGVFQNMISNIRVIARTSDLSIISWVEIPTAP